MSRTTSVLSRGAITATTSTQIVAANPNRKRLYVTVSDPVVTCFLRFGPGAATVTDWDFFVVTHQIWLTDSWDGSVQAILNGTPAAGAVRFLEVA